MAESTNNDLVSRIKSLPTNSVGRRRYTAAIKRECIERAKTRAAEGWALGRVAAELGMKKATLYCWLGRKAPSKRRKNKTASASPIKAVVVASPRSANVCRAMTMTLASGHRIEGLSLEELIAVAKALGCS